MDTEGIGKNIFNIIDGTYYSGADSEKALNPDARGGKYAKVYGPNKLILDTGWSSKNAYSGQHELNVRWFSDTAAYYGCLIEYWLKGPDGVEVLAIPPIQLHYMNDISDEYGNGVGIGYFNENYQYKVIVKSHPTVAEDEYVAVDYVRILPVDPKAVKSVDVYAGPNGAQRTPNLRSFFLTIPGDGSNYKYSATYTFPTYPLEAKLESGLFTPVVSVYNNLDGDYFPTIVSHTEDSITIMASHRAGTHWSGIIIVSCILLAHEPTISLGGGL